MYFDDSADMSFLEGKIVAVIGYGIQGKAFAANLRDSGISIVIGNIDDSYKAEAIADGFATRSITDAADAADVVILLVPEHAHEEVFNRDIKEKLTANDLFVVAHGYSIHFGEIFLPKNVDVALLAPKMFGKPIRRRYLDGGGVIAFIDVIQDASNNALEKTLAVAKAVGFTREAVIPVPFWQETELDLFQEQFLTPLLMDAFRMAFEILVENGYDPVASFLDTCGSGEMAEMMMEATHAGLFEVIEQQGSPTCRYGVQKYLGRLVDRSTKTKGEKILADIRSKAFQSDLAEEASKNYPSLNLYKATCAASELTKTHNRLREMLTSQNAKVLSVTE